MFNLYCVCTHSIYSVYLYTCTLLFFGLEEIQDMLKKNHPAYNRIVTTGHKVCRKHASMPAKETCCGQTANLSCLHLQLAYRV